MIEIEIDGKKLTAKEGSMIIQVADEANIYIPRFCYHKKMSIAANCRMCLVEVEKAPKTLPACATPIAAGMKVFTRSEKAAFSQRVVMEYLLINHPLDCPICDQGGECELQDLSMGYGKGVSRFYEGKRAVKDKNLGPLIASEMTRCIQCTRCVRFGTELAGMRELGAINRGDQMEISTYIQQAITSEVSGNIIDVCPVGALTSKPYRFTARAWEMRQHPAIAPHDCLGSHIAIHTRGEEYSAARQVMRVVPREQEAINEMWLSDRDRFSYEGIHSEARLLNPLLKHQGEWREVSWETALTEITKNLRAVIEKEGAQQIAALVSPSCTTEEGYLLQKLLRSLGSQNIDHRIRQTDFRCQEALPLYPSLGLPIVELEQLNTLLLIGSHVRHEQPLANLRIRKAVIKNHANVMSINPMDYEMNFTLAEKIIAGDIEFISSLAKILHALLDKTSQTSTAEIKAFLMPVEPGAVEVSIAEKLLSAGKTAILLGAYAINHPQAALVQLLAHEIATVCNASLGYLSQGANSAGLSIAGVMPHRGAAQQPVAAGGLNARDMLLNSLSTYLLMGIEPELDSAYPAAALKAFKNAQMVVAISAFKSSALLDYATIILPLATFAETSGTYVNVEGVWQSMAAATLPPGAAWPGWKILQELGNELELTDFHYASSEQVVEEIKTQAYALTLNSSGKNTAFTAALTASDYLALQPQQAAGDSSVTLTRLMEWPMYRIDSLVRQAAALQATMQAEQVVIAINPALAARYNLHDEDLVTARQGESHLCLPLKIDARLADNQVAIPAGMAITAGFGAAGDAIHLQLNNQG